MGDEKLRTIRARTSIRHRQNPRFIMSQRWLEFVCEAIARAAAAGAGGVAALGHKIGYHAMKDRAIIKPLSRQEDEVVDRDGHLVSKELEEDVAFVCG